MTYTNMLMEYKRSEAALRERLEKISAEIRQTSDSSESEALQRRRVLLEQELYDMLEVIGDIYGYIYRGNGKCRNA